jgi:hypothetical protein
MSTPTDKQLYKYVKSLANKKFKSPTGVYKSSWIVKKYKSLGGKYSKNKNSSSGLKRWYKEKWIDLNRPIKKQGKIIGYHSCGRTTSESTRTTKYPLCRPSKHISSKTPKTYHEISKKSLKKAKHDKKNYHRIQFGKGIHFSQYYGKHSAVMVKVPENVKKVALYSFKLKKMGFKGGLETGWKRAKQLSTQSEIPIQDLKFMRAWFARHIYASYPSYKLWQKAGRPKTQEWYNKHGIISWYIWGGDAGFKWVNSKKNIALLNKYYPGKNYKPIKLPN